MANTLQLGPIWRSMRRQRTFSLMVLEVMMGFFIVSNLLITSRWFASLGLPPSGHQEADLIEVTTRAPAVGRAGSPALGQSPPTPRQVRELAALRGLAGVRVASGVSSSQIDDRWGLPNVFWVDPDVAAGPSACPDVERSSAGVVVGWGTDAGAELSEAVDLKFVEGDSPRALSPTAQAGTVVITRCLARALAGEAVTMVGRRLYSNRHPPALIVGVIEDVRMRMPFLYQTHLTAIFTAAADGTPSPVADERVGRYLVRTAPGRAPQVRAGLADALGGGGGDRDYLVNARLFNLGETGSARIAFGTVLVLLVVGLCLGVVAVLGNLAVAAFLVGDRRRVIGVRRALGATRWDIFRYLLIENLVPTQIGNALGLLLTFLALPPAQKLFSGLRIRLSDVIATALLISLTGIAAKLWPALRATRIPPSEVSRAL